MGALILASKAETPAELLDALPQLEELSLAGRFIDPLVIKGHPFGLVLLFAGFSAFPKVIRF